MAGGTRVHLRESTHTTRGFIFAGSSLYIKQALARVGVLQGSIEGANPPNGLIERAILPLPVLQKHLGNTPAQTHIEHHGPSSIMLGAKTRARKNLIDMERAAVLPHDDNRLHRAVAPKTRDNIDALAVHALHLSIFRSIIHM